MKDNSLEKVFNEWNEFKNEIMYKNRFIIDLPIIKNIEKIFSKKVELLDEGSIIYRARIYNDKVMNINDLIDAYEKTKKDSENGDYNFYNQFRYAEITSRFENGEKTGLWGYDKENSFVPKNPNIIKSGRVNPEKIGYLYAGDSEYTALAEVRPFLEENISIAEIATNEELKIVNFTFTGFESDNEEENNLFFMIMQEFSRLNKEDPISYILTQYIGELAKKNGYDGIKYNSSLYGRGRNYAIFNYEKCEVKGSKLYKLENVYLEATRILPFKLKEDNKLQHPKLIERVAKDT